MDTQELINAGGIGIVAALLAAVWNYRAALWQWLPSFKPANQSTGETPCIEQRYAALRLLESCENQTAGYRRGCAAIRKSFLPPLPVKGDAVES